MKTIFMLLIAFTGYSQNNSNQLNQKNMFTLDQIMAAHAKVKTGADFPHYAQELKALGLKYYDNFLSDGHTIYYGSGNYLVKGPAKYQELHIADHPDKQAFEKALKNHQQGGSDYLTVCRQAAEAGIEKWTVDLEKMTCTYYDKAGNIMIVEVIPEP